MRKVIAQVDGMTHASIWAQKSMELDEYWSRHVGIDVLQHAVRDDESGVTIWKGQARGIPGHQGDAHISWNWGPTRVFYQLTQAFNAIGFIVGQQLTKGLTIL